MTPLEIVLDAANHRARRGEDGMLIEDDDGPADCPGGGIDDLCSWPDIESCGLCTLGMNLDLL